MVVVVEVRGMMVGEGGCGGKQGEGEVLGFRPRTNELNYIGQVAYQYQVASARKNKP